MVAQRELDERLRAIEAQLQVEETDWKDEERKLYELEETYLRDTIVHGNIFTGWGETKTAPVRFRNAALRRKKRERQDQTHGVSYTTLSTEEQLKVDKHRIASYSSVTSPAESTLETLEPRQKKLTEKAAAAAAAEKAAPSSVKQSPAKRAKK